jgi:transcriptional regulator with XRE-family HTH domain
MSHSKDRPPRVAQEWAGFPSRLRYAYELRKQQEPGATQNAIAAAAGVDSGNFSRMLNGEKVQGVTANTVVLLAAALRVRAAWLLTGEEPSGLAPRKETTPVPDSDVRRSSRP